MKIAAIASTPEMLREIVDLLEKRLLDDQFIFLQRQDGEVRLERVDLVTTNVVILDAHAVNDRDLKIIADCTRERSKPVFIYLCESPTAEDLQRLMHAGVLEVVSLPLEGNDLLNALERIRGRRYLSSTYNARGKVATFISCKGGAGATFVATNLAYVLSQEFSQRVLFIDLHMQDGDAAFYVMEKVGPQSLGDVVRQTGMDSTVIASAAQPVAEGFYMLKAPDSPEKSAGVTAQQIDNLITLAIQDYDFVILDIAHNLDSINMKALDRADFIFPVMQPMVNYLRAMVRQLRVFAMLGYVNEKIHILVNRMDTMIVLPLEKMQETLGRPISFQVPNDFRKATESVNLGIPIGKLAAESPVTESLRTLCKTLCEIQDKSKEVSVFSKLFSRYSSLFKKK